MERYHFPFEGALVTSLTIQISNPRFEKQLADITTVVRKEKTPKKAGPNCLETTRANKKKKSPLEALPAKM
jgi:hypothetical protein